MWVILAFSPWFQKRRIYSHLPPSSTTVCSLDRLTEIERSSAVFVQYIPNSQRQKSLGDFVNHINIQILPGDSGSVAMDGLESWFSTNSVTACLATHTLDFERVGSGITVHQQCSWCLWCSVICLPVCITVLASSVQPRLDTQCLLSDPCCIAELPDPSASWCTLPHWVDTLLCTSMNSFMYVNEQLSV